MDAKVKQLIQYISHETFFDVYGSGPVVGQSQCTPIVEVSSLLDKISELFEVEKNEIGEIYNTIREFEESKR